jgi:FkbM family methyltransferase
MDTALLATKDCRHGRITYLRTDTFVGRSLELYGEWCEGEIILFERLLHPGDVVVDVGANIGTHTLALSKLVGSAGAVHALEPQREIYHLLCKNIENNGLRNAKAYWAAAGATTGSCRLPKLDYSRAHNFAAVAVGNGDVEVPLLAIDDLNLPRANLIKIDVEGAECEVLRGAETTVRRLRPILYVENNEGENAKCLVELVRSLAYRLWWHYSAYFNDLNFARNKQNVWPFGADRYVVCLPEEAAVPPWPLREVSDDDL